MLAPVRSKGGVSAMKSFLLAAVIVVMICAAGLLYIVQQATYYGGHAKQAVSELTEELSLSGQEEASLTALTKEWEALQVDGAWSKEEIKLRLAQYITANDPQHTERVRRVLDEAEKKIDAQTPAYERVKDYALEKKQQLWDRYFSE